MVSYQTSLILHSRGIRLTSRKNEKLQYPCKLWTKTKKFRNPYMYSILERLDWSNKPSHATVPFTCYFRCRLFWYDATLFITCRMCCCLWVGWAEGSPGTQLFGRLARSYKHLNKIVMWHCPLRQEGWGGSSI